MWSGWPVCISITWQAEGRRQESLQPWRRGKADMSDAITKAEPAPALPKAEAAATPSRRTAILRWVLAVCVVAAAAMAVWRVFFHAPAGSHQIFALFGGVESGELTNCSQTFCCIVQITPCERGPIK